MVPAATDHSTVIPFTSELRTLPKVSLYLRQRSYMSWYTGSARSRRWGYLESRRYIIPWRLPRGSKRDILRRPQSAGGPGQCAFGGNNQGMPRSSNTTRQAWDALSRPGYGNRETCQVEGLQRHQDILRPRHQSTVPLCAERTALRKEQGDRDCETGNVLYDRAHGQLRDL